MGVDMTIRGRNNGEGEGIFGREVVAILRVAFMKLHPYIWVASPEIPYLAHIWGVASFILGIEYDSQFLYTVGTTSQPNNKQKQQTG